MYFKINTSYKIMIKSKLTTVVVLMFLLLCLFSINSSAAPLLKISVALLLSAKMPLLSYLLQKRVGDSI